MRVLISGGAGFIGSSLVRACLEAGDAVRVLDDFSSGRRENLAEIASSLEIVEGSVSDYATLERAMRGCEVLFHLAAKPSVALSVENPRLTHDVNVNGTLHALDAARRLGVRRVVFASSCALYGDHDELPLLESLPPRPLSPYALHKLIGELYGEQFGRLYALEFVALRFFNVYGPRQDPASPYAAVVPLFMQALARGESPFIHGDGGQSRDFIHVRDVVAATRAAALAPVAGEVLNVGSGERTSILGLFERIRALAGRPGIEPRFGPARAGDVRHSQASIARTLSRLGWRPALSLEQGLEHTLRALAGAAA